MCIRDSSYTIGEGVAESGRWPVQLADALRQLQVPLRDPRIIATTGWTTDELAHAMDEARLVDGEWDFVSLLIGVNDQYRHRPLPEFATGFDTLFHRAALLSRRGAAGVLVLSIPDWGVTPFAAVEGRDPAAIAHEPVSYTHLDVYKRQAQQRVGQGGLARAGRADQHHRLSRPQPRVQGGDAVGITRIDAAHGDVLLGQHRQRGHCARRVIAGVLLLSLLHL